MAVSRRKEIADIVVAQLKLINGDESTFDSSYTYNTNLFNNAFRCLKFLDEVNDFPAVYVAAGTETRTFNSNNLTTASLDITLRLYVYGQDNSQQLADEAVQDVEHVIYHIGDSPAKGLLDITIDSISTDEGLAAPYGLAEIALIVNYRIEG